MSDTPKDGLQDFAELRRLLLGEELEQLEHLVQRVEVPEAFSSAVGEILPQAIRESTLAGEQLTQAMMPAVEEIVHLSIRNDIDKFAGALFPVIGPAIRKSISETMRQMLQSLNQTLEQSFTKQGLQWRIQSMRTGIPISEIAMLQGLVYRVEQVFLIHKKTGLLLQHVEQDDMQNQNADMVSSMLSAINDFVGDSFETETNRVLGSIHVGDLSIWIEQGPDAILAVAIRGEAPNTVRTTLQLVLEKIQLNHANEFDEFDGDTAAFENSRDALSECMLAQYQQAEPKSPLKAILVCLLVAFVLLFWLGTELYQSMRQQAYVASMEKESGYVITSVTEDDGALVIRGMRDPLSRDPVELLAESPLAADEVIHNFEPYQSLKPEFVARRARKILNPPETVTLSLAGDDSLRVEGVASRAWRERLAVLAPTIPGLYSYDASGLRDLFNPESLNPPAGVAMHLRAGVLYVEGRADDDWIKSMQAAVAAHEDVARADTSLLENLTEASLHENIELLEQESLFFNAATTSNSDAMDISRIALRIKSTLELARKLSKTVLIMIRGGADSLGKHQENVRLSLKRASDVANKLYLAGISPDYIDIRGLEKPVEKESNEAERRFNRRVSFEVVIE